jgi:hypothetical protein
MDHKTDTRCHFVARQSTCSEVTTAIKAKLSQDIVFCVKIYSMVGNRTGLAGSVPSMKSLTPPDILTEVWGYKTQEPFHPNHGVKQDVKTH